MFYFLSLPVRVAATVNGMNLPTAARSLLRAAYVSSNGSTVTTLVPATLAAEADLTPDAGRRAADWLCSHDLLRGARSFGGKLLLTSITEEGARIIEAEKHAA